MKKHLQIHVFKTDVYARRVAARVCFELKNSGLASRATLDLDDCDRVLRVETDEKTSPSEIKIFIKNAGHACEELN